MFGLTAFARFADDLADTKFVISLFARQCRGKASIRGVWMHDDCCASPKFIRTLGSEVWEVAFECGLLYALDLIRGLPSSLVVCVTRFDHYVNLEFCRGAPPPRAPATHV
jgi:hypothetical protein